MEAIDRRERLKVKLAAVRSALDQLERLQPGAGEALRELLQELVDRAAPDPAGEFGVFNGGGKW